MFASSIIPTFAEIFNEFFPSMISRRNIRIKVFQTIFESNIQDDVYQPDKLHKKLDKQFEQTQTMLAVCVELVCQISDYVLVYAQQKSSKHLPSFEDLNIDTRIAKNALVQKIKNNPSFNEIVKSNHLNLFFDTEYIRHLFLMLIEQEEYRNYITLTENKPADDLSIVRFIYNTLIFENEDTCQLIAEKFLNWYSDFEMIYPWMELILAKPDKFVFHKLISAEKLEFAHQLLSSYYEKKDYVFSLIEPNLMNWDAERVAIIDLILLHLGICEMLYFESIPLKVSINEYIDIAKSYSTPQSGQFVNGLLDNVRKQLTEQQKIFKTEFIKKSK